jgi:hypothetical protein
LYAGGWGPVAKKNVTASTAYVDDYTVDVAEMIPVGVIVRLAKVDAEGNELNVLRSLAPLLAQRRITNLIVEVTPLFWRSANVAVADMIEILCMIIEAGYTGVTLSRAAPPLTALETCTDVETLLRAHPAFTQVDLWFQVGGAVNHMCAILGDHCGSPRPGYPSL